jgi:NitT/TauT family transport system substrate-binding protein
MIRACRALGTVICVGLLTWVAVACQSPPRGEAKPGGPGPAAPAPAAAPAPTVAAPIKVRMSQPVAGLGYTSIYVANRNGYFADEGLDMEVLTLTTGGGPDTQALIAGDVQFGATGTTILIAAYQEGTPLLGVVSLLNRMNMHVAMRKDVAQAKGIGPQTPLRDKLATFRGTTIGVTRLGSLTDQVARYYAHRAGLTVGEDVTILAVGTGTAMMAALDNRLVDAVVDSTAALGEAVDQGLATIVISAASGEDADLNDYLQQLVTVRPDYARDNPEIVRKVVRAVVRANRWVNEHSVAELADLLTPDLGQRPSEFLVQSVKLAIPPDGRMTERGVLTNYEMMELNGTLKGRPPWNALVTNEYLPQ